MTATDSNHVAEKVAEDGNQNAVGPPGTLQPPDASRIVAKAKEHNIRVAPAVLDAAAKDGDELLQSLRTAPQGLTQQLAEKVPRWRLFLHRDLV